jgi:uncharacterized protein (DUF58 family)
VNPRGLDRATDPRPPRGDANPGAATVSGPAGSAAGQPDNSRLRVDPRLPAYLVAGFGALIAAIATGRPELAALGAPFIALAAIGLVDRSPPGLSGMVTLAQGRVIEGDRVRGKAQIDWDGVAEVDVMLAGSHGVSPVDPTPVIGWSLAAGPGPVELPFELQARSWGVHDVGALWVRVRRPGGLLVREQKLAAAPPLQVLPTPIRLERLLRPAEPRAVSGMHLSRFRGHGTDFAELRPYQPGDRLRDLSWATSARLGQPWVAVRHPERTGTVLLLMDAFISGDRSGPEALARAARAGWAVASVHLKAQDRVGLLARGQTVAWLPPRGGRRARWMLLDELLDVGGAVEDRGRTSRRRSRVVVPADALVVGVTSLGWRSFVRDLLHYRRAGHTTVALVIDTSDLLPAATGPLETAARRLWLARRDAERHSLERGGILTALVTPSQGVGPAISSLRRRMNARQQPSRSGATSR